MLGNTQEEFFSRLRAGSFEQFQLARAALRFKLSKAILLKTRDDLKNLDAIWKKPKPHQVEGLLFFWNQAAKRAYLADDVGLGKTTTAALALHQLVQHGHISHNRGRVLVLCPKAVIKKWEHELRTFSVWPASGHAGPWSNAAEGCRYLVTTYNSLQEKITHHDEDGNAWRETRLREALFTPPPGRDKAWDLVILDEAHRSKNLIKPSWTLADGTGRTTTQAFGAYRAADSSHFAILLSATPINNDLYEIFSQSLVCCGRESPFLEDPEAPHVESANVALFEKEFCCPDEAGKRGKILQNHGEFQARLDGFLARTTREEAKEKTMPKRCLFSPRRLSSLTGLVGHDRRRLELLEKYSAAKKATNAIIRPRGDPSLFVVTERAFLSSDAAVTEHLRRRKEKLWEWKEKQEQEDLFADLILEEEVECIDQITKELKSGALGEEPKYQSLLKVLDRAISHFDKRNEEWQVVIFTFFRDTARSITGRLGQHPRFRGKVMCSLDLPSDPDDRDRLISNQFCRIPDNELATPGPKRILIATDALHEGVDLQSANIVINYDLPWNPAHIEQRIGRLQRIQSPHRSVFVFNLLVPGAKIEERICELLYVKARLINDCFLSTYKFGVGEDPTEDGIAVADGSSSPLEEEISEDRQTLTRIFEEYLAAESDEERQNREEELLALKAQAQRRLESFKKAEEKAKKERVKDTPPTPEEVVEREELEAVAAPDQLMCPEDFARSHWRQNNIYPGRPEPGRYSIPQPNTGERVYWATPEAAQTTDEILAPHSISFKEMCDKVLQQGSLGCLDLSASQHDWAAIASTWLAGRYSSLSLVSCATGDTRVTEDWAAEVPLRISHNWRQDGPREIQPLLTVQTAPGIYEQAIEGNEDLFVDDLEARPHSEESLMRLDSLMRREARKHENLDLFCSFYEKVLLRKFKDCDARAPQHAKKKKKWFRKQMQPRLSLLPGILMSIRHPITDLLVHVKDQRGRIGKAQLTACLATGQIKEDFFLCAQSAFFRPLNDDTVFISGDGRLVHAATERRVCAETGDEFGADDYASHMTECGISGVLLKHEHIRECSQCNAKGWYRLFVFSGQDKEMLCPNCAEYSNGRRSPAPPWEFLDCPVTGLRDTYEFFVRLDDGTDRAVHSTGVVQCDVAPIWCSKDDVLTSDISGRTGHKSHFEEGAISRKVMMRDDPEVLRSPTGRYDLVENFMRSWLDGVAWLDDEMAECAHCSCWIPSGQVGAGRCPVCRPTPKGKPANVTDYVWELLPDKVTTDAKQKKHAVNVKEGAHCLYVEVFRKRPLMLRFRKPVLVARLTYCRDGADDYWQLEKEVLTP